VAPPVNPKTTDSVSDSEIVPYLLLSRSTTLVFVILAAFQQVRLHLRLHHPVAGYAIAVGPNIDVEVAALLEHVARRKRISVQTIA
jgi:hypothetical protein